MRSSSSFGCSLKQAWGDAFAFGPGGGTRDIVDNARAHELPSPDTRGDGGGASCGSSFHRKHHHQQHHNKAAREASSPLAMTTTTTTRQPPPPVDVNHLGGGRGAGAGATGTDATILRCVAGGVLVLLLLEAARTM